MHAIIIYTKNSGSIPLTGLMDEGSIPPVYVNNASPITATLNDPSGNPVAGLNGEVGVYVAGSNGNYNFPVEASFNAPAGGGYTLIIDATEPVTGAVGHWELPANVVVRGRAAGSS